MDIRNFFGKPTGAAPKTAAPKPAAAASPSRARLPRAASGAAAAAKAAATATAAKAAATATAKSPAGRARRAAASATPAKDAKTPRGTARSRRVITIVDSDDDDDDYKQDDDKNSDDDDDDEKGKDRNHVGKGKSSGARGDDEDDDGFDDNENDDDGDDFVLHVPMGAVTKTKPSASRPSRQQGPQHHQQEEQSRATPRKRARADTEELAKISGAKVESGGAGFGGGVDEDKAGDDAEPDSKKSRSGEAYLKFLNRGGPVNKGAKELPVGAPNCLDGKVFVITGILDSLEREECTDLIKQYGGRCVTSVSKKVTHGVVGTEPGESKLKKLTELKIPQIDEDALFEMINSSNKKKRDRPADDASEGKQLKRLKTPSAARDAVAAREEKAQTVADSQGVALPRSVAGSQLWVDKYKPRSLDDLVANPRIYEQIGAWLRSWKARNLSGGHVGGKSRRASAGSRGEDDCPGMLLAGPPGIGKTTAAHIICRENGFEPIEFNASDVRNKGGVQQLGTSLALGSSMSQYFSSSSSKSEPYGKASPRRSSTKNRSGAKAQEHGRDKDAEYPNGSVLIMDEVDGMSGGDRGGSQELLKVMKTSRIPIICICNDDSSPKMRTLANNCYKLKFRRPMSSQVRDRLLFIARKEGFHSIDSQTAERLAEGCHGDIRQMINLLQTWRSSSPSLSYTDVKGRLQQEGKSFEQLSIFDVFQNFFSIGGALNTIAQRMDNFFLDSDLIPLFIAENYLSTRGARESRDMVAVAEAAGAISEGDLSNAVVRRDQRWDLMPVCSVLSSVLPGSLVAGGLASRPAFPSYLGNISKGNKFKRIARELEMRVKAVQTSSGSVRAFRLDYIPTLTMCLATPLIKEGGAGIPDVIERLDAYYLQKDDWTAIMEIGVFKEKRSPLDAIPGLVKAALTREYNKLDHALSTVTGAKIGAKGKQDGTDLVAKKAAAASDDVGVVDEDIGSEEEGAANEDDSDVDVNEFKVKPKSRGKAPGSAGKSKAKPRGRKSKV